MRRALEQQELRVYYQPVHDLKTSRLIGVEALVRWEHPLRGLVPPGEFIPIAERTGLIAEIDAWVLEQACWQMCQWQSAGVHLSFVAVNISSRLFACPCALVISTPVTIVSGLAAAARKGIQSNHTPAMNSGGISATPKAKINTAGV